MTGKVFSQVMADKNLRWVPNFTGPCGSFPGYNEPESPFHDKRVRQAVSPGDQSGVPGQTRNRWRWQGLGKLD